MTHEQSHNRHDWRRDGWGRVFATLLTIATLAGCNGSGSGGDSVVYFGNNGRGICQTVQVNIDLAGGVSADGNADNVCVLSPALAAAGCDLEIFESSGELQILVRGCAIPAAGNMFSCSLSGTDTVNIQRVTTSLCGCAGPERCDVSPPICVSEAPDHTSCESCTNAVDDDGNGVSDCSDANCRNVDPCATTTTSTSSTTTTTTTSTTGTTTSTTTTLPGINPFAVAVRVESATGLIGAIQVAVDYSDAGGDFAEKQGAPDCKSKIPGALFSSSDNKQTQTLTIGIVSLDGFSAPATLATCEFNADSQAPEIEEFQLVVEDASDPQLQPIEVNVLPDVDPIFPNSSTTTSTTLEAPPDPDQFLIIYELQSASGTVGALQFETHYSQAPGEFQGTAGTVNCRKGIRKTIAAFNDNDATETLGFGFVSLNGFDAPQRLATCIFRTNGDTPVPGDFPVQLLDASDPDFNAIAVQIKVRVESGQ